MIFVKKGPPFEEGASFDTQMILNIIWVHHVLCPHKMYKRTLLYIVISGLLFRRHPNANTASTNPNIPPNSHLQGGDEDQRLHHHHHHTASTCWQQLVRGTLWWRLHNYC